MLMAGRSACGPAGWAGGIERAHLAGGENRAGDHEDARLRAAPDPSLTRGRPSPKRGGVGKRLRGGCGYPTTLTILFGTTTTLLGGRPSRKRCTGSSASAACSTSASEALDRDGQLGALLAVHLHGKSTVSTCSKPASTSGQARLGDEARVAERLPALLGEMRHHRRDHQDERLGSLRAAPSRDRRCRRGRRRRSGRWSARRAARRRG